MVFLCIPASLDGYEDSPASPTPITPLFLFISFVEG
jgi:hypothetical protein